MTLFKNIKKETIMKKLFALMLAFVMMMSLAACGGNSDESKATQAQGESQKAEEEFWTRAAKK